MTPDFRRAPSDDCPQQQCLFLSRESDLPSVMTRNMPQTMHFLCQTRKCILPQELLSYPYRATIQSLLSVHYCLLGSATKQGTNSLKHTYKKINLVPFWDLSTHTHHTHCSEGNGQKGLLRKCHILDVNTSLLVEAINAKTSRQHL